MSEENKESKPDQAKIPPQIEVAIKIVEKLSSINKITQNSRSKTLNESVKLTYVNGRNLTDEEDRVYNSCLSRIQSYVMSRFDNKELASEDKKDILQDTPYTDKALITDAKEISKKKESRKT